MRCHYEVLGINRDANSDDIKKAYRKNALQWHPDKNADNIEEANRRFLEIQEAYETLLNDQDRAWYDAHREVLINGGKPGEAGSEQEYLFNIYPYFSSTCFKGYGDDEKGFYSVYRDIFKKIAEEDKSSYENDVKIPDFGDSTSNYEEIVGEFYAFWQSYCTPRSFVWVEQHDTREAQDRYVRRLMEKENKKAKDKAKKERNEEIRKLVAFVRKRDKRVDEYKKFLEDKAKEAQKKSEEKREADRRKRLEQMRAYVEPEWIKTDDKEFEDFENINENNDNNISSNNAAESNAAENDAENDVENDVAVDDSDASEDSDFYCIVCNKSFKSDKAFINHEKSKKHKENLELVKKHMKEEDQKLFFNENDKNEDENNDVSANNKNTDEKTKNKLSKKQKKRQKQKNAQNSNQQASDSSDDDDIYKEASNLNLNTSETNDVTSSTTNENVKTESTVDEKQSEKDESINKPSICSICKEEFESRNKLFEHIKEKGHAMLKPQPKQAVSSSSTAKNKKSKAKK